MRIHPFYDGIKAQSWREGRDWGNSQNGNDVRSALLKNSHIPIIPWKRCNNFRQVRVCEWDARKF